MPSKYQPMDERWKNVWAYIGTPRGFVPGDGGEHEGLWQGTTEFLMEVVYDGMIFWSKQVFQNEDLESLPPEAFNFILDQMVEMVDGYMKEHGR